MTHANETLLRNAYAAFAKGDVPAFLALCSPDITFTVPGNGLLAGRHDTQTFLAKLGPAMEAVGGSFGEAVIRVVANDIEGVVWAKQHADRDGRAYQWNAVHWWRIQGGKLVSFDEFVDDASAFEAAWHR